MKPLQFFVPGEPIPQPRARTVSRGGFTRSYYPDNGIYAYREAIAAAAREAGATPVEDAPLTMIVDFVFVRPPSHFHKSKKRAGQLRDDALVLPPCDSKNLLSGVEDALNGVAYADDRQIAKHIITRSYGETPGTMVWIKSA